MANVVKKHSISSDLAQKMVDEAVAKARELGVSENVAILDDGGNLKAFSRMDGAPLLSIEIAQNKAYTALFGVSTQDFFNFIQGDPSLLAGIPTLSRVAAYGGGFPVKVNGEIVGAIGLSGAPTVQNDVDCAKAALALVCGEQGSIALFRTHVAQRTEGQEDPGERAGPGADRHTDAGRSSHQGGEGDVRIPDPAGNDGST
ncbi:uncharacterized protein GlcG (DUF336 family) [Edaphobacter modestus]|uniref:Uncharacterized protein GlcG (DUF336 family) n=1 Tax=Edaphobacter modestus TaxID=388466 RepID=A0A4Q7YSB0_9BACT|nr:uncharacterized protein GlcG (DUF336 family) [Edaphobacter modestus]